METENHRNFFMNYEMNYVSCRLLEEKEGAISELESRVSELGAEAGDRTQLLESVQSDKTALSRALTQNKDLKQQLAELQNGFVKMVSTLNGLIFVGYRFPWFSWRVISSISNY